MIGMAGVLERTLSDAVSVPGRLCLCSGRGEGEGRKTEGCPDARPFRPRTEDQRAGGEKAGVEEGARRTEGGGERDLPGQAHEETWRVVHVG